MSVSLSVREATVADLPAIVGLFSEVYDARHGDGAAADVSMAERTAAGLFGEVPTLTWVYEPRGVARGVAAVRLAPTGGLDLVALQVTDSVPGRAAAQVLVQHVVAYAAAQGVDHVVAAVPADDVRARGFLRREGFEIEDDDAAGGQMVYRRAVSPAYVA